MPKIEKTVGTGMTARCVVSFDWSDPTDIEALRDAAIASLNQTSFGRLSQEITRTACRSLATAGLPTDISGTYAETQDGGWKQVRKRPTSHSKEQSLFTLPQLVLERGYQVDSPEGYSALFLLLIQKAKDLLRAGQIDEAMATAFTLGNQVRESGMKETWELDALRGEKIVEAARSGHEHRHGSEQTKAARRKRYAKAFQAELAKGLSKMAAYEAVAERFGVSAKTIRRVVSSEHSAP